MCVCVCVQYLGLWVLSGHTVGSKTEVEIWDGLKWYSQGGITNWSKTEQRRISDKSLWETGGKSQPEPQTAALSLSSVCVNQLHLQLTVCTLNPEQVLCMKWATMRRLYVSRGCENIPVITMENSPSCHQMGEILWVCLLASVCYSGTILLCLFSETVDV